MDNNPTPTPEPTPAPAPEPAPVTSPTPAPAADQPLFANNNANAGGPKKSHTGLIIGLTVGIVAIAAILIVVFAVIIPNANKGDEKKDDNTSKTDDKKDDPTPTPTPDPDPTPTPTPTPDPDPTPTPTPTPSGTKKTLTCVQSVNGEGYKQTATVYFNYIDNKLDSITMTEETYKDEGFTDQEIKEAQKESNAYYDSTKYSKWEVTRKDKNTVILNTELKLDGNDVSNYQTYENAKSYATTAGYSCK